MMSTVVWLLIIVFILIVLIRIFVIFSVRIQFYTTGIDSGFRFKEIKILWSLAETSNLEDPIALFWSVPAIDRSIAMLINNSRVQGTEDSHEVQLFLEQLYAYRTKVELDPKNKRGIKTTKSIDNGQRLRILLKNYGVFASAVVNNGRELVISLPRKDKQIILASSDWVGKSISVYFRRYGDASYVFDTTVHNSIQFNSIVCLYLNHSENLLRTQKRKTVRCECSLPGQIFIDDLLIESHLEEEQIPGLKCLIEDISEEGALIRIGGQGKIGIKLKLQVVLNDKTVLMYGIVRSVEYNQTLNVSRMHFQCLKISPAIKNHVLTYVYSILSQENKDVFDAILQADEDAVDNTSEINIPKEIELDEDADMSIKELEEGIVEQENK